MQRKVHCYLQTENKNTVIRLKDYYIRIANTYTGVTEKIQKNHNYKNCKTENV